MSTKMHDASEDLNHARLRGEETPSAESVTLTRSLMERWTAARRVSALVELQDKPWLKRDRKEKP